MIFVSRSNYPFKNLKGSPSPPSESRRSSKDQFISGSVGGFQYSEEDKDRPRSFPRTRPLPFSNVDVAYVISSQASRHCLRTVCPIFSLPMKYNILNFGFQCKIPCKTTPLINGDSSSPKHLCHCKLLGTVENWVLLGTLWVQVCA